VLGFVRHWNRVEALVSAVVEEFPWALTEIA